MVLKNFDLTNKIDEFESDFKSISESLINLQVFETSSSCESNFKDSVRIGMEQIDLVRRISDLYPDYVYTLKNSSEIDILSKKLGVIIGMKGGHVIDSSLEVLRAFYEMGLRKFGIFGDCPEGEVQVWRDFTKNIVGECNRLGIWLDVSDGNLADIQNVVRMSESPVSVICQGANCQNLDGITLQLIKDKSGMVLLNSDDMDEMVEQATFLLNSIGAEFIGINSGMDKINTTGMKATDFPAFFEKLKENFSEDQIKGIQGENLLNFLKKVEEAKNDEIFPDEAWIPDTNFNTEEQFLCWSEVEWKNNENSGENDDNGNDENDNNSGSEFINFTVALTVFGFLLK